MQFNVEASDATRLLQLHRNLVARIGEAPQGSTQHAELKDQFKAIDTNVRRMVRVQRVDPRDTGVLEQLIGRDDVHDFGTDSIQNLRDYRIGDANGNKICIATVNPFTGSRVPQVLSAIYVSKQADEIPVIGYEGVNGHAKPIYDYRALAGNVHGILQQGCETMDAVTRSLIFYSITNIKIEGTQTPVLKGSGEILIGGLFPFVSELIQTGRLPADVITSTLSPLRSLRTAWKDSEFDLDALDDDTKRMLAIAHLLTGRDGVQRFHGSNGVIVGDIKLNANVPESEDGIKGAGAMINYVYDLEEALRTLRQQQFRGRQYGELLAPHLRAYVPRIPQALRLKIAQ